MPPCDVTVQRAQEIGLCQPVSILVLMDAALRHVTISDCAATYSGFNPCFNGCRPATAWYRIRQVLFQDVSILVLMDAALRLSGSLALPPSIQSFNPCFNGCRPATSYSRLLLPTVRAQSRFQSLF